MNILAQRFLNPISYSNTVTRRKPIKSFKNFLTRNASTSSWLHLLVFPSKLPRSAMVLPNLRLRASLQLVHSKRTLLLMELLLTMVEEVCCQLIRTRTDSHQQEAANMKVDPSLTRLFLSRIRKMSFVSTRLSLMILVWMMMRMNHIIVLVLEAQPQASWSRLTRSTLERKHQMKQFTKI